MRRSKGDVTAADTPSAQTVLPVRQRRRGRQPLRPGQIIIVIAALLGVAAPLLCGYFVTSLYQSEVTAIRDRLEIPAHAMSQSTEAIARNADRTLRRIEGALLHPAGTFAAEAVTQVARYRESPGIAVSRVAIYDLAGMPFSPAADPLGGSVAKYKFFQRQLSASDDDMLVSDLVSDPVDGKPSIALSRRIVDNTGNLRAIAAVFVDVAYLQRLFDSLDMPAGTSITAFNRDGHMVVRTPAIHIGDLETINDFTGRPIYTAFRDGPANGTFAKFTTIVGVDRFIAGVGGPDTTFVIAAGWDTSMALAAWREESLAIAGAALVAFVIVLALLAYLRTQIHRNDHLLAQVSGAEQRQRDLMAALPDALAIVDESLTIEFANPAAERIYGYDPGEMNGLPLSEILAPGSKYEDELAARRALFSAAPESAVSVLPRIAKRKDGSELPVEITACRYVGADGAKLISVIRDVAVRNANDLALRRSRENLARAQSMAALGSFERDLATGAMECSDEFLRMWGFELGSGQPSLPALIERVHPQDREDFVTSRVAVLSGQPMPKSEFRIVRPNGEERILYHEYSADFGADGRPTHSFGIVQDITERKKAEMELRRNRENLARAQRVASLGSFDRDLVTGRSEWSEEFMRIWGVDDAASEDTAEFLVAMVHPEDREKFLAGRAAAINNEPVPPLDFRITRPDGESRVLHREYGAILDDRGRAVRLFGTVQDVTERKKIEDELRRSREDLSRAQQIAAIGSFSRDIETGKIERSEEFLRIWGFDKASAQPNAEALAVMVHPEDREKFLAGRDAALNNRDGTSLDFRVTRPDGEERILHREYGVLCDDKGIVVRMFGTVQDITERKRAENELRRHRENLAHSQRIAGVGSFERDLVTGKWEWSDELYHIHGVDRDDPNVDVAYLRNLVHPEDRDRFDDVRNHSAQGITIPPIDFRIIRPDGAERILHRECELVRDADGKPVRLVATLQDITDRRRAELELRRSRENMARAQRLATIGSFERDLVTGTVEWTEEMFRILGLEVAHGRPGDADLYALVHPDDRERFAKTHAEQLSGKPLPPLEYRIVRPDGVERVVRRECAITFDTDKRPIRLFGTLQDITERKRAELAIMQSRENMMRAQRIANMGSFDHDLIADRIEWSDQMYRILGVDKDEVSPSPGVLLQFVHPDDRADFLAARSRVTQVNSDACEFRVIRRDGEERVVRRECDVHFAEDGRPIRIFGTVQDITERRGAEARERELERQLLHSQKLEALGTLAGGIAHDLNNTLVPIMALSKLTARRFEQGTPVRANLDTIYEASERARDLVRRVLAFSRKDEPEQQEANLGDVVREVLKLMRATVPTSIELDAAIADVPPILADASQIHQVITNLVSNAVGAMTSGMGVITVSLGLTPHGKSASEVCLSVADSGCGMDEATQQRIFEPFFTTKAVGQGTGLGLSIVHGIMASHGGRIEVNSKLGRGTRFDLYFPLPKADKLAAETNSSRPAA
jgi:PAS domain S-box-containing protein